MAPGGDLVVEGAGLQAAMQDADQPVRQPPERVVVRLAEIHDRYGPGHLVSRSIQRATPMILRAVEQVNDRAARSA